MFIKELEWAIEVGGHNMFIWEVFWQIGIGTAAIMGIAAIFELIERYKKK